MSIYTKYFKQIELKKKILWKFINYTRHFCYKNYYIGYFRFFFKCLYFSFFCFLKLREKRYNKITNYLLDTIKNHSKVFVQFPVISWDAKLFQRPQQLAKAMSEIGYFTIYLLPIFSKFPVLTKISNNLIITNQIEILPFLSNAIVSVYLNYPPFYLDKYLTEKFLKKNKVFCEYIDHIDPDIWGVYFSNVLKKRFKDLRKFCFIVGTSSTLCEELISNYIDSKVLYLPNGVDLSHYRNKNHNNNFFLNLNLKIQDALKRKKKIIGYFGAIAPWIWFELINNLAKERPNYFILMIGPNYGETKSYTEVENICFTGHVDYNDLPYYTKYFDVSIIPFRLGVIAKTTSPIKLFEYFAIGKPIVVTSDLIECTKFEGVAHADNPESFIKEVDNILTKNKKNLEKLYQNHAKENSWHIRAKKLEQFTNNTY